jgi:hypothetical protein
MAENRRILMGNGVFDAAILHHSHPLTPHIAISLGFCTF